MARSPMMPLWTDAYLGDTHHLSTLEHGAYFLLLMTAWRSPEGTLPDDDRLLSKYTRLTIDKWKKIRPVIEGFFTVENGKWIQSRLMDEREADFRFRKSQSEKAKARHMKNKDSSDAVACSGDIPPPSPSLIDNSLRSLSKNKQKKFDPARIDLPDWLPMKDWIDFAEHRRAKGSKITEGAATKIIEKLGEYRKKGHDPSVVIGNSIANGWTGIFEPKNEAKHGTTARSSGFGKQDYSAGTEGFELI